MNMTKKLTVSELSSLLGVSVNTTWKKIHRKGLLTDKEVVNNREITVVLLTDDEYNDLISERNISDPFINQVNNPNYEDNVIFNEGVNDVNPSVSSVNSGVNINDLMDRVINYSLEVNNQMKEYVDRVINAEKQVKLLEDLERRKDDDFSRMQAEIKELKALNEQLVIDNNTLKEQLEKKKGFAFWKK